MSPESRRKDRRPSPKNRFGYSRRDFQRSRSRSRERKERREDVERRRRREEETYERNKKRTEKLERSMINKQKLLEIAKKNAAKILKSGGDLIGFDQDRLIAMRLVGFLLKLSIFVSGPEARAWTRSPSSAKRFLLRGWRTRPRLTCWLTAR